MAKLGKKFFSVMYTPPNQLAYETAPTPSTWRMRSRYASGRENTSDTAFLLISRADEDAFTPAYQALTTVWRRPNARMATVIPKTVRNVRKRCRKALRERSLRRNIVQQPFFQMTDNVRLFSSAWVVGNHDDGF